MRAVVATLVVIACSYPYHAQPSGPLRDVPVRVEIDAYLGSILNTFYEHLDVEVAVCLEGAWKHTANGHVLRLKDCRIPGVLLATPTTARSLKACRDVPFTPRLDQLAIWHTHKPMSGKNDKGNCYLSPVDARQLLRPHASRVSIVQCGIDRAAWWHVSQVDTVRGYIHWPRKDQWVVFLPP